MVSAGSVFRAACLLACLACCAADVLTWAKPAVRVDVPGLGTVVGTVHETRTGRLYYSFRGIRYAQPPVGPLRFSNPVASGPWTGLYDATKNGPTCIQYNFLFTPQIFGGEEDCLFLNVYAPENIPAGKLLPVMVTIHGGGFFAGDGSSAVTGPAYFMDHDVVKVVFNYRLGALGFLSTGDDVASGNWGLKDQLLALRWVQEHIAAFGGDKDSVTIMGQSAGGASVHYHMLTQSHTNLFHRVIMQSGSALNLWAGPFPEPAMLARAQAAFVKCDPQASTKDIVDCLRNVDVDTLIRSSAKFKVWDVDPIVTYIPVLESETAPEPYLTKPAIQLIREGNMKRIPLMVSTVQNEGSVRTAGILNNDTLISELNQNFTSIMAMNLLLGVSVAPDEVSCLLNNVIDQYMDGKDRIEDSNMQGFIDLYSDRAFVYPILKSIKEHWKAGQKNIYSYNMAYKPEDNYCKVFTGKESDFGTCHCDDLTLIYNSPKLGITFIDKNHKDYRASKMLVEYLVRFATDGKPGSNKGKLYWPSIFAKYPQGSDPSMEEMTYLYITDGDEPEDPVYRWVEIPKKNGIRKIGNWHGRETCNNDVLKLTLKGGLYVDRMNFWTSLNLRENSQ